MNLFPSLGQLLWRKAVPSWISDPSPTTGAPAARRWAPHVSRSGLPSGCVGDFTTSGRGFLSLFTPKSGQRPISPAAAPEILYHTVWRTWLFTASSYGRWLYHQSSLPHLYIYFRKVGRMYFSNLGVKGLNRRHQTITSCQ